MKMKDRPTTRDEALRCIYILHQDPGHSWLEVPIKNLTALGFELSDFSQFSYQKLGTVYLEEDGDAPKFIRSFTKWHQPIKTETKFYRSEWPGRNYNHIQSGK